MYDRLIDDYLNKVTKDMGYKQREDVRNELRSHILDSADALAAERNKPVDESIVREVLSRMGPAEKMAAEYPVKQGGILADRVILVIGGIIALILVLVVVSAAVGACAFLSLSPMQNGGISFVTEQKEYNASHAAAKNISIDVSTFNGAVEVLPSSSNAVDVKVVAHAPQGKLDQISADIGMAGSQDNLDVNVAVKRLTGGVITTGFGSFGGNVYVYVPNGSAYNIDIQTSNGMVHVGDFSGEKVKLATSNAGITVDGGQYDSVDARTSNGRVYANYNATDAVFETSNSAIELDSEQTTGTLRASTSNGRITLDLPDTAGYSIDASTSNGRITHSAIPLVLTMSESNHIVGHTERMPAEGFSVNLHTSNSGIDIS
jgi:hypothetical protein